MLTRPSKEVMYLNMAYEMARRGTCMRRNYGAIIVKDDVVIAGGYTGAPRGQANCIDLAVCKRTAMNIPTGERYELCRSVHAEQNAIISAARSDMIGSDMYVVGIESESNLRIGIWPCQVCMKLIINAGISRVYIPNNFQDFQYEYVNSWRI